MPLGSQQPHWSVWVMGLLIFVAPVAAPREAYALQYALWLTIFFVVLLAPPKVSVKRVLCSPLGLLILVFLVIAAIQLLPLPLSWLEVISPYSASSYQAAANDIAFAPITLDSTATWGVLHICFLLLTMTWWGIDYLKSACNLRVIEYAVIISASAQAVLGTLMVVTGLELGAHLQAKEAYIGSATGTFVNRSIFALYLNLGIATCLKLLFFSKLRPSGHALLAIRLAMVVLVVGVTMSHSRAAALGFIGVMAVAFIGLILRQRKRTNEKPWGLLLLLASVVVIDLLVVSQWYGLEKLASRASSTSIEAEQRDDIVQLLFEDYRLRDMPLGIGLGAFEAYYPQIESIYSNGRYVRAHSDVAELGISLGFAAVIIVVLVTRVVAVGNFATILLVSAMAPHMLLDFAVSHWLICFVVITLLPIAHNNQLKVWKQ